jgi:hypothetical protein
MRAWTHAAGEIVRVSKEAAQLFNLPHQHLQARHIHYFLEGDRQQLFAALQRAARGLNGIVAGASCVRATGQRTPCWSCWSPTRSMPSWYAGRCDRHPSSTPWRPRMAAPFAA